MCSERITPCCIHPVLGPDELDAAVDAIVAQRVVHEAHRLGFTDFATVEVPVRIERDRINLAEIEVIERECKRIRGQEVESRSVDIRACARHEALQRREVIVGGCQTIIFDVLEDFDERLQSGCIPVGPKAVARIKFCE